MILTDEVLKSAMPLSRKQNREKFLPYLNEGMARYQIDTKNRITMFLANLSVESGQLRYVEEIASGRAYENRRDLGNLAPEALKAAHAQLTTTGKFYKGHGLIQITGYYNHKECGEALGVDAVNNPKILATDKYAALSACWFWASHGCNEIADIGDFRRTVRTINGGYNGWSERVASFNNANRAYA